MLIIDLDSLAGLSINKSESNMGPSNSFSFMKPNLFAWAIDVLKRPVFLPTEAVEQWLFIVASHPFVTESFKLVGKFPSSPMEEQKMAEAREEQENPVTCVQCLQQYVRSKNDFGDCTFHKLKLVCYDGDDRTVEYDAPPGNVTKERLDFYRHPCCHATYDPRGKNGCVAAKHKYDPMN